MYVVLLCLIEMLDMYLLFFLVGILCVEWLDDDLVGLVYIMCDVELRLYEL